MTRLAYSRRKQTTHIIVHHSLTPDGETVSWPAIRRYHMSKGWLDIGYHFGIELIGKRGVEILVGRPLYAVGAHTRGKNSKSVGICVVGDYDRQKPSRAHMERLAMLVSDLWDIFPEAVVAKHGDFSSKSCPGTLFSMPDLIKMVCLYRQRKWTTLENLFKMGGYK